MKDIYQAIADRIIAALDSGNIPWQKPWGSKINFPRNLATGKSYRGINVMLLSIGGFSSPYWLTFRQALDLGGHVRKGEKGTTVVFWGCREVEKDGVLDDVWFLRTYSVFNVAQCELPAEVIPAAPALTNNVDPIESAQTIADGYLSRSRVALNHGYGQAFYRPSTDTISMPDRSSFCTSAEYYSTLFHEMAHSTGHPDRLDRLKVGSKVAPFGSQEYSREELVAEFGAAFVCGAAGIVDSTIENSTAYIRGWRKFIADDPRAVVYAAAQAQKAADLILNVTFGDEA